MRIELIEICDARREELSAAVEAFNAETDPAERVKIFARIKELRALLSRRPTARFRSDCAAHDGTTAALAEVTASAKELQPSAP